MTALSVLCIVYLCACSLFRMRLSVGEHGGMGGLEVTCL